MGYIYKITNLINNKCYIGQTTRKYTERWAEHKRDRVKEPYCNWPLYRMLNSTDPEQVQWEMIEEVPNGQLNERETYWIQYYNSKEDGYNCTYGGDNGTKHNYEQILDYWLTTGERNFTKTARYFNTDKAYISDIIKSMGYERRSWEEINNTDHDSIKRAVNQIDKNTGQVIATYDSVMDAARAMGDDMYARTISPTCNGKHPTYLGYCWQYVEDIGKPIYLNKQQKTIIVVDYNLEFNTLNDCAKWFIQQGFTQNHNVKQVAGAIRYGLDHSKTYKHIRLDEKEKVIYSYYGTK